MRTWHEAIAAARTEILTKIEQRFGIQFGWTMTAKSSSMGDTDQVQTADGDKGQRPARRLEQWGLRGRPPGRVRSFWVRLGSSNVVFLGIAPTKGYGPNDLDEGEVAVYSISKALIRLWKTGKLSLDSDSGGGADVVVNGGTLPVARKTDPVSTTGISAATASSLTFAVKDSLGATGTVTISVAAGVLVVALAPPTLMAPLAFTGSILDGALNFKG